MTTVFGTAIGVLFGDPHMAVSGTYRPQDGGPDVAVRLIVSQPDRRVGWNDASFVVGTTMVDVQIAECAAPDEGDMFVFGGKTFVMQGQPEADELQLVWTLELVPE